MVLIRPSRPVGDLVVPKKVIHSFIFLLLASDIGLVYIKSVIVTIKARNVLIIIIKNYSNKKMAYNKGDIILAFLIVAFVVALSLSGDLIIYLFTK